jgi:hypothetical protein
VQASDQPDRRIVGIGVDLRDVSAFLLVPSLPVLADVAAEELRQRGEDERARAIEALVDAAQQDVLPRAR